MGKIVVVHCIESKPCFAKENGMCKLLISNYKKEGDCKFCKPKVNVTNGKKYELVDISYTR